MEEEKVLKMTQLSEERLCELHEKLLLSSFETSTAGRDLNVSWTAVKELWLARLLTRQ